MDRTRQTWIERANYSKYLYRIFTVCHRRTYQSFFGWTELIRIVPWREIPGARYNRLVICDLSILYADPVAQ